MLRVKLGRRTERRRSRGEEDEEMKVVADGVAHVTCVAAGDVAGAEQGGQQEEVLAHGVGPPGRDRPLLPPVLVQALSRLSSKGALCVVRILVRIAVILLFCRPAGQGGVFINQKVPA